MIEKLIADIDKHLNEKIQGFRMYTREEIIASYKEASRQALISALKEQYQAPEPLKRHGSTLYTSLNPDSGNRWYTTKPEATPGFDWKPL